MASSRDKAAKAESLVLVMSDLLSTADHGKISILALLDLSAAFDPLDHFILLQRFKGTFGIPESALAWFKPYFTNISQNVAVNNKQSNTKKILYGVPRGSVLGPVLFVMYTKPLSNAIKMYQLPFHFYADDTQLYIESDLDSFDERKFYTSHV